MKKNFIFLAFLLLLIATFFAYHYFSIKPQNDIWDESRLQAYEPLCEVEIPIVDDETGSSDSKFLYIAWQSMLFSPIYTSFSSGSQENALTFEFEKKCPTAFNYFLLYDLYPDHVREPFFKHNQHFDKQSRALESPAQPCELTVSLPNIYEEFQERLTQYLKLHLMSFDGITAVNHIDGHTLSAQLSFNSTCDQVLADYLMQDLLPADYFQ